MHDRDVRDCFSVPEYLPVTLGASLGKVVTGSHITAGFKEDKRNKATPGETVLQLAIFLPLTRKQQVPVV